MRLSPSNARFSSFALTSFTSLLRFQGKCVSICKCIMPNSNLFVAGSKVTNDLVTYHGEDNVLL